MKFSGFQWRQNKRNTQFLLWTLNIVCWVNSFYSINAIICFKNHYYCYCSLLIIANKYLLLFLNNSPKKRFLNLFILSFNRFFKAMIIVFYQIICYNITLFMLDSIVFISYCFSICKSFKHRVKTKHKRANLKNCDDIRFI